MFYKDIKSDMRFFLARILFFTVFFTLILFLASWIFPSWTRGIVEAITGSISVSDSMQIKEQNTKKSDNGFVVEVIDKKSTKEIKKKMVAQDENTDNVDTNEKRDVVVIKKTEKEDIDEESVPLRKRIGNMFSWGDGDGKKEVKKEGIVAIEKKEIEAEDEKGEDVIVIKKIEKEGESEEKVSLRQRIGDMFSWGDEEKDRENKKEEKDSAVVMGKKTEEDKQKESKASEGNAAIEEVKEKNEKKEAKEKDTITEKEKNVSGGFWQSIKNFFIVEENKKEEIIEEKDTTIGEEKKTIKKQEKEEEKPKKKEAVSKKEDMDKKEESLVDDMIESFGIKDESSKKEESKGIKQKTNKTQLTQEEIDLLRWFDSVTE